MLQDLRFAFRLLVRERWFSVATILVLALGIGVNAIGFTIVNAALFRGLPFEDPDRLYMVSWEIRPGRLAGVSYVEFQEWRAESRTFAGLAAFTEGTANISDDRALPQEVRAAWVTADALGILGTRPLLGRAIGAGDNRRGAAPAVVISHRLWKTRYDLDPNPLGRTLRVNGQPATIVGVMAEDMNFPDQTELWAPFVPTDAQEQRSARILSVFGRLSPGLGVVAAQAEFDAVAARYATAYPETTQAFAGLRIESFTDAFVGGPFRTLLIVIMGAVGFVLLIACANVANLRLARSAVRAREIAVRLAMGASRWRVVRQLLIESLVLGLLGGGVGLLLTGAGVRIFDTAMAETGMPYWIHFTMDYVVFGYAVAICVLTAILFGLAPALHVSKTNTNDVLKDTGRGSAGSGRVRWFSGALVISEIALTVVLLAGAGLMVRSFLKLSTVNLGFTIDRLTTMRLRLPEAKYPRPEARRAFLERLEPRLAAIPGVEEVAVTTGVPPLAGGERLLEIDRPSDPASNRPPFVSTVTISPRFFDVLGVSLLRGRAFRDADGAPGAEVVIVNERLVAEFFGGDDPIGRRLRFTGRNPSPGAPRDVWRTIVGVSPSIPQGSPSDAYLSAVVYMPYRQDAPDAVSLLVRSTLDPGSVMNAVGREVQAIDPDQPVFSIQTVEQVLEQDRWAYRVFGSLFALFAVIALILSSVGLYAVMAYSVTERTREIGVRMAVGALPRQVWWLILKLGLVRLALGLTIGLAGAVALTRVLQRLLVDMDAMDPTTFLAITLLLSIVSIVACLLPARRATRIDPLVALRAG